MGGTSNGVYRCPNNSLFTDNAEKILFQGYFKEDGLTHNYVSGILPDEHGVLWMSTWKGIVKYEPSDICLCQFTPYSFSDGLIDEKYNRNSIHWDRQTNTYYFGSVNGVNYVTPVKPSQSETSPTVLIGKILLDGSEVNLFKEVNFTDSTIQVCTSIEKKGIINLLQIQFGSSNLHSPLKQIFAWKLEGLDSVWTCTRDRVLIIQDIKPGRYILKIKAVSINNEFGAPVHIPIIVKSSLAEQVVIPFLIISLFAFLIYRYRRKEIVEKTTKKRAEKYVFSKLTEGKSAETARRLNELMQKDKQYLQSDLTADKLSALVGVSAGELSQIFNEHLDTRFYEYINKYRVEEFVRLLKTSDAKKLTLTALSEKCGFSAKSTFYRAFNNEKGMTPAQFAKSLNDKK